MNMDRIEFELEELQVASEWHGGQASMMYAISSTGALSRGAERCRPRVDCEADESAECACDQGLYDDGAKLDDIADKCRAVIVLLTGSAS